MEHFNRKVNNEWKAFSLQNATDLELYYLRAEAWKKYFNGSTNQVGQRLYTDRAEKWGDLNLAKAFDAELERRNLDPKDKNYKSQPKPEVLL